ncbi:hypothetical protein HAP47_0023185 [Bradyrhizobium sp. 41S5]|uniref:hypothetical protein n=1 Tax=Bradyrhizobium sp. 41S5 TaxID=1404443 RepID=UPI001595EAA6|nr:hypothetical protein [Bradyrhizobium sp. 41S5]UFX42167.1 hypothetical protein HAP47_0023185 [Bradyrhizobium sp. 41S5]
MAERARAEFGHASGLHGALERLLHCPHSLTLEDQQRLRGRRLARQHRFATRPCVDRSPKVQPAAETPRLEDRRTALVGLEAVRRVEIDQTMLSLHARREVEDCLGPRPSVEGEDRVTEEMFVLDRVEDARDIFDSAG